MFLALSFFLFFSISEFRSPCGLLSAESGLRAQERGQKGHGNPVILNPLLPQICFVVFEIAARAHRAGFGKGTAPSRPRLSAFYLFIFVILLCPPQGGAFLLLSLHLLVVISRIPYLQDYLPSLPPSLPLPVWPFLSGAYRLSSGTFPFPGSPPLPAFLPIYLAVGSPPSSEPL